MDIKQLIRFITDRVDPSKIGDAKNLLNKFLGDNKKFDISDIPAFLPKLTAMLKPGTADEVKNAVTKFAGDKAGGGLTIDGIAGKVFGK